MKKIEHMTLLHQSTLRDGLIPEGEHGVKKASRRRTSGLLPRRAVAVGAGAAKPTDKNPLHLAATRVA